MFMVSRRENWTQNAWAASVSPAALAIHTQPMAMRMEAMVVPQAHSSLAAMCCQGVAGRLERAAAEQLRLEGRKARVSCSYAALWFRRHPQYRDVLF